MRFFAGTNWEFQQSSLIIIYATLDYDSCLNNYATASHNNKLYIPQINCLKAVLGTLRTTSVNTILIKTWYPLLETRNKYLASKFPLKQLAFLGDSIWLNTFKKLFANLRCDPKRIPILTNLATILSPYCLHMHVSSH